MFTLTAIFHAAYQVAGEIVPPAPTISNPVSVALNATGSGTRYDVGPGKTYPTPNTMPWGSLVAGDVVNIWANTGGTDWLYKIATRGQGTALNPIIINGVTDASGNRPVFNFDGATTAAGCNPSGGFAGANDIFSNTPAFGESLGGIVIKTGPNDPYHVWKPNHIQIKNLELKGARNGASYTALNGSTQAYNSASGVRMEPCTDVIVENCVIHDNGFGIFTQGKGDSLADACERVTFRSCRVYNNGVSGSYLEHNFYVQCANPIVEFCFIGQTRSGSLGSSFKSRSSADIFRFNYVQASARALDFVDAEEQLPGIQTQPDYGTDYVYGNVIENNFNLPNSGASNSIHYGGDKYGADDGSSALVTPARPYRSQLYFFGNTYIQRVTAAQSYRTSMFDLSLVGTKVDAWNNNIVLIGDSNFYWTPWAGTVTLRGKNAVYGTISAARDDADPARYSLVNAGTLITSNPLIVDVANGDYRIGAGSPLIDQSTALPAGVPSGIATSYPITHQPVLGSNGGVVRTVQGSAFDLGALEYGVGAGVAPSTPVNATLPVISGTPETGATLTASTGTWTGSPDTYAYQWKKGGVNISGATASTYVLVTGDVGGVITVTVTATNVVASTSATSAGVTATAANLPVNTVLPAITGTPTAGNVLTASSGTWTNSPTYAHQWKNGGVNISGQTASTYTVQAGDAGSIITVTVTATNVNGSNSATSNGIAITASVPASIGNSTVAYSTPNDNAPVLAIPSGAVSGDEYWLAIRYGSETNTVTWPAGFTEDTSLATSDANLGAQLRVARKTTAGGESGNFAGTLSGYSNWAAACVVVKGMSATPEAHAATSTYAYTASKPMTGAPITTTGANRLILWFGGNMGAGAEAMTLTPPSGLANVVTSDSGVGNTLSICAGVQASAGTVTYSGTADFVTANSRTALVATAALVAG